MGYDLRHAALAALAACVAFPAAAACPPVPDQSVRFAELVAEAQAAQSEGAARGISNRMWEIWATAPDAVAQEMLDRGMARRAAYDFDAATEAFDALVAYCPDYAEGYNQRAFVNFIRRDYGAALEDLDRALARRPDHVAALSGKALTLMGLGREAAAQAVLREALKMNPWLPERRFLVQPSGDPL